MLVNIGMPDKVRGLYEFANHEADYVMAIDNRTQIMYNRFGYKGSKHSGVCSRAHQLRNPTAAKLCASSPCIIILSYNPTYMCRHASKEHGGAQLPNLKVGGWLLYDQDSNRYEKGLELAVMLSLSTRIESGIQTPLF